MGEAEEAAAEGEATLFFAGGQETQQFANAEVGQERQEKAQDGHKEVEARSLFMREMRRPASILSYA